MKCKTCAHKSLMTMITSGRPYMYAGDIPCRRCIHLLLKTDEYSPSSNNVDECLSIKKLRATI